MSAEDRGKIRALLTRNRVLPQLPEQDVDVYLRNCRELGKALKEDQEDEIQGRGTGERAQGVRETLGTEFNKGSKYSDILFNSGAIQFGVTVGQFHPFIDSAKLLAVNALSRMATSTCAASKANESHAVSTNITV